MSGNYNKISPPSPPPLLPVALFPAPHAIVARSLSEASHIRYSLIKVESQAGNKSMRSAPSVTVAPVNSCHAQGDGLRWRRSGVAPAGGAPFNIEERDRCSSKKQNDADDAYVRLATTKKGTYVCAV